MLIVLDNFDNSTIKYYTWLNFTEGCNNRTNLKSKNNTSKSSRPDVLSKKLF